ncbi:MAG: 16S rRNA (adenine(1518)-N(6)/adenine(1519)-N(6))-dimethyltransferase [Clostridiales bacterium 43-6]|nr:MAG: 16S rRNA (adenine(1518)-N(6)/adenine(1519)-N(6))-dimethyltransferase [Clostridiales bacterium 43-6]
MNLSNIGTIKGLLNKYGFSFSKKLGQNFLINPSVCPRMASECGADSSTSVLEIGPGIGVLTAELSRAAKKVVAIELDERLKPVLSETLKDCGNVTVLFGDVLKLDLLQIITEHFNGEDIVLCANLPYYITSPILMHLLENRIPVKSITVMVQKEAADRLCAPVGTRQSGSVTVAVNYYATAKKLFDVSRGSFLPAPNVDSAVIKMDLRATPPVDVADVARFFKIVRASFSQRRKTVANSLSSGLSLPKEAVLSALEASGIQLTARAEELSLSDFEAIYHNL